MGRRGRVRHAVVVTSWGSALRRAARSGLDLLPGLGRTVRGGPAVRDAPTRGRARAVRYAPRPDGAVDPGEVVWAWVPYEENDGRGKDRPLLVVGRERGRLLGLMLSSRPEHAADRRWVPVGSGPWDRQGRESFVRLDRVLEFRADAVRREGAVLPGARFDRVAAELRTRHGWT